MTTDTLTHAPEEPAVRYGGWHRVTSPGIGPLGLAGTVMGIGGLVVAFVTGTLASPSAGLVLAIMVGLGLLPLALTTRDGRNGYAYTAARLGHGWARRRGRTRYTPNLLGGRTGLGWSGPSPAPGPLARAQLRGVIVPIWGEVGVLRSRSDRWSVLLDCPVDGAALVDEGTLTTWADQWGHWLGNLPHEAQIVGTTVTVETYPDTGATLAAETARLSSPDSPALATAFLDEVTTSWPGGSYAARCWITLTFTTHRPGRRPAAPGEMADLLIERLPGLCSSLASTGAGRAAPMTPDDVVAVVRTAFDPAAAPLFDAAAATGHPHGLDFADAGPVAAVDEWQHLRHDEATSVTYKMTAAPSGDVTGRVLAPLLDPRPGLLRKRVTLIYRHHDAVEAARIADADLRTAAARAGERRGQIRAEHAAALGQARAAADEQATGAGLTRLSLLVSATVATLDELPVARAAIEQLAAQSRLRVRPCLGSQLASFIAALGVGVLPTDISRVPDVLREAL
jgi:hypothetical protein